MSGHRDYRLNSRQELAAGPRLGGKFGPSTGTQSIWTGRPPELSEFGGPRVLSLALRANPNAPFGGADVRSVDIRVECGNAFGGLITRDFTIGEGISADLRVGSFRHVRMITTSQIPVGTQLYFCWVDELPFSSSEFSLISFLDYPTANTRLPLPEGCIAISPENACTLTWTLVSAGNTFVQAAAAGVFIPVKWGTFQANIVTKFICRLRGF